MLSLPLPLAHEWFEATFYCNATETGFRFEHEDGTPVAFAESQGVDLWCPCGIGMRNKDGTERYPLDLSLNRGRPHRVMVPFANPPCGVALPPNHGPTDRAGKSHPRWTVSGSGLHDLSTLPSIDVGNVSCWHGYITNGIVK